MSLLITSSSEGAGQTNQIGISVPYQFRNNLKNPLIIEPLSEIAVESVKLNRMPQIDYEGSMVANLWFGERLDEDGLESSLSYFIPCENTIDQGTSPLDFTEKFKKILQENYSCHPEIDSQNIECNVVFDSNKSRNDISGNALSKISVFQGNTLLKYFNVNIENVNNERIFLESIQEFSGDGLSSKPPYEFEYINENLLPGRMEYLADHWGYYSANGTEFPYLAQFPWRSAKSKEPSDYAMYGSLKKIVFPTGGLIRLNMN